jgi:ribosomal protein S27E
MSDPTDPEGSSGDPDGIAPADAFSTLGHPVRLEIVSTLSEESVQSPLQFSALYELVGAEGTGRFNYHLGELVPHFVSKTDDGYELTAAGERLARAVTAGTFTDAPDLESFELDGRCYDCGADSLRGAYEDEAFRIECRDCGRVVINVTVPPSLVRGRDPESFVDAFDRWSRSQVEQARQGLCPDCGGAVDPAVVRNAHDTISFELLARFDCAVCGRRLVTSFGALAAAEPEVEAFHRRRGTSFAERPYWEIPQYVSDEWVEVVSRDPTRVRVTFVRDGDTCRVDIDDELRVVETTIVPGRD